MTHIYWVRHGENPANLTKEFSSRRIDYPLTAKGILQAEQTSQYFASEHLDEVYASPLLRARQTAEIIARQQSLPVKVMDVFRELDVGDLEMRPVSAANWEEHNQVIFSWLQGNLDVRFPGGENYIELRERMERGYQAVIDEHPAGRVVIVSHGGCFMATLQHFCPDVSLDWLFAKDNPNCSISELELNLIEGLPRGRILSWATCTHLHGKAADLVAGFPQVGELE